MATLGVTTPALGFPTRYETNPLNTLFISASAEARVQRTIRWLSEQDTSRGVLVIGPTRTAADELVRLVAISGDAVFGWHRLTLIQVARSIASWASQETAASVGHLGQKASQQQPMQ